MIEAGTRLYDYDVIVVGGGPSGAVSALKCSELGLTVLLVERGKIDRHKPCGGILPPICDDVILDSLGKNIPRDVMCSPVTLGLYYVPPSGRRNGGIMKNYRLLNINRDLFDSWLRQLVTESGVKILYETEFLGLQGLHPPQVLLKRGSSTLSLAARYLIGADGVYSRIRTRLYGSTGVDVEPVLQEHWRAEGDFDDNFYAFFRGDISPTYAYVIPKDGLYVIGLSVQKLNCVATKTCVDRFKNWLHEEFDFKPKLLMRRESWAIPYGSTFKGVDNVILVGDAAGFCNALSGEGIRLAIESGIAAGDAVQDSILDDRPLAQAFEDCVEELSSFICRIHQFATSLTDKSREEFVDSELARIPI